jgi:glycosyltransferase involved in cell wall biosynthesis
MEWHLITSEYPPQPGGVSDYSQLLASGLASAGEVVHVWCASAPGVSTEIKGVTVHRELGRFSRTDLRRLGMLLRQFAKPRRLLVQWVPHGYGYRSLNIGFCLWVWQRAVICGDSIELMVHEPYLPFLRGAIKQNLAAAVQRLMAAILLRAASKVWVSIPAWGTRLQPYAFGRQLSFDWLPVPSNVPEIADASSVAVIKKTYTPYGGQLIGHFGTYGRYISSSLAVVIPRLLHEDGNLAVLLLGNGGKAYRDLLVQQHPGFNERIHAPGQLDAGNVSKYLAACDLLIQPYPDGVTTRRTSIMAGLAHGLAIVTTIGNLTEDLWANSQSVALVGAGNPEEIVKAAKHLLTDEVERQRLKFAAKALYQDRFDLEHTVSALTRGQALPSTPVN